MKRTTAAFIQELRDESVGAISAGLIVRFETSALYISIQDTDPIAALDTMIENGGEPVGLFRASQSAAHPKGIDFSVRPIAEYAADPAVSALFTTLPGIIQALVLKEIAQHHSENS